MPSLSHKRGTRAQIDAAASANALRTGEVYLITDEARLTVGTSTNAHEPAAKQSDAGGGGADPWVWTTLAADVANSTTTLAAVTGLSFTAAANTYFGTTEGVSGGRAIGCADGQDAVEGPSGVWYSFVGTGAQFSFSTCSESTVFATNIAVFTGACFNLECVSGESSPCGQQGVVSFPTTEGEDYFIRITGANATEFGNFVLGVSVRSVSFGW